MQQVFEHFNREAGKFDLGIKKSVPHYDKMLAVLAQMLPFSSADSFKVIDIGTGTGNVARMLRASFPKCGLTCLDLSPKMIEKAIEKLKAFTGITYIQADVSSYKFDEKYDAIVSSLTLHHLETDKDKHAFHVKAFKALNKGGAFINADIIAAPGKRQQEVNLTAWKDHIRRSASEAFVKDRYKKYLAEDRPAVLLNELLSLKAAGFKDVDVFWKYYNFAVYGGYKK